ncbi:unnamed protein product [Brachionus calyciflorus]|uniref:Reverse transcriptase/retrotransposon-derived protein RNase H-like domain-containing protein n=1 Tax=Brachionus calyciflorus TaxID=104777 RepID=A0A814HB06_9BILA|nr:unnamed protein product [Brachionus calyciflorus]
MEFNEEKCAVMHYGSSNQKSQFLLGSPEKGHKLFESTKEKDLDVMITNDLKSKKHIAEVTEKSYRELGLIRRSFKYRVKEDNLKINYLLFLGGNDVDKVYQSVKDETDTSDVVMGKLTEQFQSKFSSKIHVLQFREIYQFKGEIFDNFVTRLKEKATICSFADEDNHILELKLDEIIKAGKLKESVTVQLQEFDKISGSGNLLSYMSSVQLGIINKIGKVDVDSLDRSVIRYVEKYPELFSGKISEMKNYTTEVEIKKMLDEDIIEPIDGPKPGRPNEVRICTDAREANKAILRSRHASPTVEDHAVRLNGAKYISKFDLRSGYNQLVLEKACINAASEIFQKTVGQLCAGIDGALNFSNDIIVFGLTKDEHDMRFEMNVTFNWEKRHEQALQKLNKSICVKSLSYFDPKLRTEITVDASPVGVWACTRAVELIFRNVRSKPKARIERWCLRLLPYKFVVKHKAGAYNIADFMSRNLIETADNKFERFTEPYVNMLSTMTLSRAINKR